MLRSLVGSEMCIRDRFCPEETTYVTYMTSATPITTMRMVIVPAPMAYPDIPREPIFLSSGNRVTAKSSQLPVVRQPQNSSQQEVAPAPPVITVDSTPTSPAQVVHTNTNNRLRIHQLLLLIARRQWLYLHQHQHLHTYTPPSPCWNMTPLRSPLLHLLLILHHLQLMLPLHHWVTTSGAVVQKG